LAEVETVNVVISPLRVGLAAALLCPGAGAQVITPLRSASGQFTVRQKQEALASTAAPAVRVSIAGGWAFLLASRDSGTIKSGQKVTLEPAFLLVSCENLKALLLKELEMSDRWQGRVDLKISPQLTEAQGPLLTGVYRPGRWDYELELPKSLDQEILVRTVVQTLFLEIANRQAGSQSAEVPFWLVEGMSARLQANNLPTLILQPGQRRSGGMVWNRTSAIMPEELRHHAALTFQQLSWPQPADLTTNGLPLYRACAELFLEELLRLPDGRACLRSTLAQSAQHLNWQTAFLLGFRSHFAQLLDVEKWWGLSYVDFANGKAPQSWTAADCWEALKNSLDVPVQVSLDTNRLPVAALLTLQEVIQKWPPADAARALQGAIGSLRFLAARATPESRLLAILYAKTLAGYLNESQTAQRAPMMGQHAPSRLERIKADAIKQLDALDRRRAALRAEAVSTNLSQSGATGSPGASQADDR
jgi:hypothetical protein